MKTLTDEAVVKVLDERMGWQMIYPHGGQVAIALRFEAGNTEPVESRIAKPDWLHSRDALAPVLAGLSGEEWFDLATTLGKKHPSLPSLSEDVKWLLTIPPADLARAVASVLVERSKESA